MTRRIVTGFRCLVANFFPSVLPVLMWVVVGCSTTPDEPGPGPRATQSAEPAYAPLDWTPPATWTVKETANDRERRAVYRVPPVGDDKAESEVMVMHFGTGAQGSVETNLKEWNKQFDGDPLASAERVERTAGKHKLLLVEWTGRYSVPMGPKVKGRSAMQVVKDDYRMVGAVVQTESRGNWFFRLVGPNDTVLASKQEFISMLETAK